MQARAHPRGLLDGERTAIAADVLRALDPTCREIFVMRFDNGMQYGEISRRLGKSEGALRVQMHRCVQRARELLERTDRADQHEMRKG